ALYSYEGSPHSQIQQFENNGKHIFSSVMINYQITTTDMKDFNMDDSYTEKLQQLKDQIKEKPNQESALQLYNNITEIIDQTFDQYFGLRQSSDFRGIPEIGETLVRECNAVNTLFR